MAEAFVLGNGVSRKGLNLAQMRNHGIIYGCNALFRDYTPDVLIATDKPIAMFIQQSGYSAKNKFYTRKPISGLGALTLPQKYHGFSSGPNAVGIAALDANEKIYLVGFDMGPTGQQKFNNVYADSEFYKTSSSPPTFTGNWIRQLKTIFTDFPTIQFVRVMGPTTQDIPDFVVHKNFSKMDLSDFIGYINTRQGLK